MACSHWLAGDVYLWLSTDNIFQPKMQNIHSHTNVWMFGKTTSMQAGSHFEAQMEQLSEQLKAFGMLQLTHNYMNWKAKKTVCNIFRLAWNAFGRHSIAGDEHCRASGLRFNPEAAGGWLSAQL